MRDRRLVLCCMRRSTSCWSSVIGPSGSLEQQPAVAAQGSQRRPEIVYRPRQEVGSILIVLLQFQVGLDQALQDLIHVGAQRGRVRHPVFLSCDREGEKCRQGSARDRLEQNIGVQISGLRPKARQVFAGDQAEMTGSIVGKSGRDGCVRQVPEVEIGIERHMPGVDGGNNPILFRDFREDVSRQSR